MAALAIGHGVSLTTANQPTQMYFVGFEYVFSNPEIALAVTIFFVILSQIKIDVTNAYAGSLAWSNFFSRLTHSHPGRVVWLVFNVAISLLLMELGVFSTLEAVLGLYSNVAIAWVGALVADLVINKPLGLSPSYIEFKRAHLYRFNPVGCGSMLIASLVSMAAFVGIFGSVAKAFASFIALGLALVLSPAIALLTQGKYYIAREDAYSNCTHTIDCCICEQEYEPQDMAFCPVYKARLAYDEQTWDEKLLQHSWLLELGVMLSEPAIRFEGMAGECLWGCACWVVVPYSAIRGEDIEGLRQKLEEVVKA